MATPNEQLIKAYQGLTAEQQAKFYSAWNSQVKRIIDAYKSTQNNTAQPQGLNTEQQQRLEQVKSSGAYQEMINKWLTDEQIIKAISQYKPTNPVETPTQPQSTTRTQSTPTPKQEIQPQKAPTATTQQWRPELLPESYYKDDSDQRQREIVANLNEAVYLNPQSLSDYNTFANYYNYEGRSDLQKQTLDNRYLWYQKSQEYLTKSVKELQSLYNANVISQSDLSLLKVYDPNKYNELNSLISKTADLKTYADQLSGTEITTPTNPFQWIIDNFVQWLQHFSQTNFYDEYRDTINSPALKQKNQEIIAEQAEMDRLDLLINNKRKDVEERYAGTGATKSKIAAIIADETYELQLEKANRAITLNAMVNSYNSELGNAREELNLKLQEYNMGLQQRQQQMQELWFMMNLMNFETNAQRDEREWNNFIRQQEYADWNIYSTDPKTRQRAVEKAVDRVLAEFQWIPMIRSREQMVEDITVLVNGGMSLWEAITENIRKPIMDKPEYKKWVNDKFWIDTSKNLVNIWWVDYLMDEQGNFSLPTLPWVWLDLWFIKAWDLSWLASQYPWEASFKNNNPAWITWGVSDDLKKLWTNAGINFTKWTARPANEWGLYVKFDTIEDWMKAYDIAMTQRRGNATVKTYLNWWGTWTVWLPENILNKKVKDLSAEEKKTVQNAQIKKESPWLYNYLQGQTTGQWMTDWQSNIVKSWLFDATFETYFEQQKKITSLGTEKDRQAIFASMWISSYTEFQRLANERKLNKPADQRTIQLLEKLDSLEKWVKTFWPRSLEVSLNPDLKADYNFIKSNLSLESLQAAKAKWATFWALSDAEWKILSAAATALSPRLSAEKFQSEIQNIRNQIYENYPSLRTQNTQQTIDSNKYFWNLVNNQWAGNLQDNDISFILWY